MILAKASRLILSSSSYIFYLLPVKRNQKNATRPKGTNCVRGTTLIRSAICGTSLSAVSGLPAAGYAPKALGFTGDAPERT
jgi:hypothetical protein